MFNIRLLGATLLVSLLTSGCRGPIDTQARQDLLAQIGSATVTVYPVFVRSDLHYYNDAEALRLGEFLASEKLAVVTVTSDRVDIPGEWGIDQSAMFRESVEAFRLQLSHRPPATDYALLAEYLLGSVPDGEPPPPALGIHCYVLTRDGRLALGIGLNSHHKVFADANPRTIAECTDVLIRAIEQELCRNP